MNRSVTKQEKIQCTDYFRIKNNVAISKWRIVWCLNYLHVSLFYFQRKILLKVTKLVH